MSVLEYFAFLMLVSWHVDEHIDERYFHTLLRQVSSMIHTLMDVSMHGHVLA